MVLGRFREVGNGRPVPFFLGTNGKVFISIMSPCVCQQLHRRHKHTLIWRTWTWTRPTWGAFSSYTLTLRWHEAYWKAKARQRARRQTREISQWNQKENCRERESEREKWTLLSQKNSHVGESGGWGDTVRMQFARGQSSKDNHESQTSVYDCQLVVHACN